MMFRRLVHIALAVGLAPLAGCLALKPVVLKPVQLSYDTKDLLIQYERPARPSLRIVPFADKRPDLERKGVSPDAHRLVLYNWRKGTFVSGNDLWLGKGDSEGAPSPLPESVAESLRECLQATRYFGEIAIGPADTTPPSGETYLLRGTIESFFAEQKYRGSSFFFIFFFGDSESFWAPKATCRLTYELAERATGRLIKRGTAEAIALSGEGRDISRAGLQALRLAETRMANEVTQALAAEEKPVAQASTAAPPGTASRR